MEFCNIIIGRFVSSTVARSCIKRNLIYIQAATCSTKHSSTEYLSDSDEDEFASRGKWNDNSYSTKPKDGYQSRQGTDNYQSRNVDNQSRNVDNYQSRDGDENYQSNRFDNNYQRRESGGYNNRGRDRNNFRYERNYGDSMDNRGFTDNRGFAGDNLSKINWDNEVLTPLLKNVYEQTDVVSDRSDEHVDAYRKSHDMTVTGKDVPKPIQEFTDYNFPDDIQNVFSNKGFERPTPIQAQGWPTALSGRDLVGIGQTGSGKTLGYILPAVCHIKANQNQEGQSRNGEAQPTALVMAPTRELAQQIELVARDMKRSSLGIKTACLYGGASKGEQIRQLRFLPNICIATPGRLLDLLEMGCIDLKRCSYLVLDEADRMLDMGFEPQIKKVVSQIRPDRQTLMWSATWPKEIRSLAYEFLDNYVQVKVGSSDLTANADIVQEVEVHSMYEKEDRCTSLVSSEVSENRSSKILIFCDTKRQVDILAHKLNQNSLRTNGIHGDHSQARRDGSLRGFRTGRCNVLVATDVASRGIDVNDISLVINYDCPNNIESYIHRIGRTGRAGKSGKSMTFVTENDMGVVKDLVKVLREGNQKVPQDVMDLLSTGGNYSSKNKGSFRQNANGKVRYNDRYNSNNKGSYNRRSFSRNDRFSDYE